MRKFILSLFILFNFCASAQEERDTVLKRCPIFIVDTATNNNFFIEARPATLKVYRVKGDLTVVVEQREQMFTLFFGLKRLKSTKYKISTTPNGRSEIAAKYSFHSGDQVSYVNVSSGTVEVLFDKEKEVWLIKVNGLIANYVERTISYYKVKGDLTIK
jgi:hypothetical protein